FAPETIDEQIAGRLAGMAPGERETRVTQGVARLHRLPPSAELSLARVRAQLRSAPLPTDPAAPQLRSGSGMIGAEHESPAQQRGKQIIFPTPRPQGADTTFNRTRQQSARAASIRHSLSAVAAVAVVALVLAGFFALSYGRLFTPGASPSASVTHQQPGVTATTTPLTFAPPASAAEAQACRTILGIATTSGAYYDFGQGIVGMVNTGLTYPGYKLPDNLPRAPYQVDGSGYDPATNAEFAGAPPVAPITGHTSGITLFLCNVGTQAVMLQGVNARLDSVTAYTGALNVWFPCDGTAYSGPNNSGGGGCGSGMAYDESMQGAFGASATTGASITMTLTNAGSQNYGPFPFSFPAGKQIVAGVGLTLPTAPGVYSFSFGLTAGGIQTAFAPAWTTLSAPAAHTWTGPACQQYAAQIPPQTNPPSYYVCPQQ
ncbi:MAG: hypothetical protein ABI068_08080, partial [Ktedonobacterales bacterium]